MLELVGIQDARPERWDLHILDLIKVGSDDFFGSPVGWSSPIAWSVFWQQVLATDRTVFQQVKICYRLDSNGRIEVRRCLEHPIC